MYKEVLRSIDGLGIYPTISFTIFFIFFVVLLAYVWGMRKPYIDEVSRIPLEDEPTDNKKTQSNE